MFVILNGVEIERWRRRPEELRFRLLLGQADLAVHITVQVDLAFSRPGQASNRCTHSCARCISAVTFSSWSCDSQGGGTDSASATLLVQFGSEALTHLPQRV